MSSLSSNKPDSQTDGKGGPRPRNLGRFLDNITLSDTMRRDADPLLEG